MSSAITDQDVGEPIAAYCEMAERWQLINDLMGGTNVMRQRQTKWLPQMPKEEKASYAHRIENSYLYGALADTVEKLAAKPFSKMVTTEGDLPERLAPLLDDADLMGKSIHEVSREYFRRAVSLGITHVLVDYPPTGGELSGAEEAAFRPYFVHARPENVIGWRYRRLPDGRYELAQVRIRETGTQPVGAFGEEGYERVRVWNAPPVDEATGFMPVRPDGRLADGAARGTISVWQAKRQAGQVVDRDRSLSGAAIGGGEYELIEEVEHSYPGVPLKTLNLNPTGLMTAAPPLEDLAWLNLAHWQSSSDQRNYLQFARIGLLFGAGFSDDDQKNMVSIGPGQFVWHADAGASLQTVEHSGSAAGIGMDDLKDLQEKMEVLGLQPLIRRSGQSTATEREADEGRTISNVQSWVWATEEFVRDLFEMAALWTGEAIPEDFKVSIFSDFGIGVRASQDIAHLISMMNAGTITRKTGLAEIRRRGLLSDMVDIDEEVGMLEAEEQRAQERDDEFANQLT